MKIKQLFREISSCITREHRALSPWKKYYCACSHQISSSSPSPTTDMVWVGAVKLGVISGDLACCWHFKIITPLQLQDSNPDVCTQLIWCRGHEYQYIFISTKMTSMCLQDHKMHWTRLSFLRIAMRAWDSLHSNSNPSLVLTLADYHQPHFYPILWFAQCRATLQCCIDRWGYKPSVWNSKPGIGIWDGYNQAWIKSPKIQNCQAGSFKFSCLTGCTRWA